MKLRLALILLLFASSALADEPALDVKTFDTGNFIHGVCISGDKVICATDNGLVEWDRTSLTYERNIKRTGNLGYVAANSSGYVMMHGKDNYSMFFSDASQRRSYNANQYLNPKYHCLIADSKGSFWAGTDSNGLYNWNDTLFADYIADTDSNVLDDVVTDYVADSGLLNIIDIDIDDNNVAWFATNQGIYSIDNGRETRYNESDGLISNTVNSIATDKDAVWIGTREGLSHFDGTNWTSYTRSEGLASNKVNDLLVDNAGNLWVATNNGVSRFDGESWETFTKKAELMDNRVTSMAMDNENRIWFCSKYDEKGMTVYENGEFLWHTMWSEGVKIPSHEINVVASDSEGHIWLGWDSGCAKLDNGSWISYTVQDGLAGEAVQEIYPGDNGAVWLKFEDSSDVGMSRYYNGGFQTYSTDNGLTENRPKTVHETADGSVWFAFSTALTRLTGDQWKEHFIQDRLLSNTIFDIAEATDGTLWLGTEYGLTHFDGDNFYTYTEADGLLSNRVDNVEIAADGSLWCLAYGQYLTHFDGLTFSYIPDPVDESINAVFYDIKIDRNGVLWGLKGRGGQFTDRKGETYFMLPRETTGIYSYDGVSWQSHTFPDNSRFNTIVLKDIAFDEENILWAATDTGLVRFDGNEWSHHVVDGPIHSRVNDMAVDLENVKWFMTNAGISSYENSEWQHYLLRSENMQYPEIVRFTRVLIDPKTNKKWFIAGIPNDGIYSYDGHEFEYHTDFFADQRTQIDMDGVLWRVSAEGVESYDGVELKTYTTDDGLLTNKYIQMHIDQNNIKWFFSREGLTSFDGVEFKNHIPEGFDLPWDFAFIDDDSNGKLWMVRNLIGVFSFDGENWNFYRDEINASGTKYYSMKILPDDSVWLAHTNGTSKFYDDEWTLGLDIVPATLWYTAMYTDILNRLWIVNSNTVDIYDGQSWQHFENQYLSGRILPSAADMDGSLWVSEFGGVQKISLSAGNNIATAPNSISLYGNYPNPFNAGTAIEFELSEWGRINLDIYNMLGQKVRSIHSIPRPIGKSAILWDGTDNNGNKVSSGSYFYRLKKGGVSANGRMMFVK